MENTKSGQTNHRNKLKVIPEGNQEYSMLKKDTIH